MQRTLEPLQRHRKEAKQKRPPAEVASGFGELETSEADSMTITNSYFVDTSIIVVYSVIISNNGRVYLVYGSRMPVGLGWLRIHGIL